MSVSDTQRFCIAAFLWLGVILASGQERAGHVFFHNGDALTGQMVGLDSEAGHLSWAYPESPSPFAFDLSAVSHVLFHQEPSLTGHSKPLFRLTLTDGDTLIGVIESLDDKFLNLDAGFVQPLAIPRAQVHRLDAALNASQLVYQGPNGPDEWAVGYRGKNWRFDDGRLISESYSSTGRELKIPERTRIELDVSVKENPTLNLFLCADNPRNGGDSYYYLQLTPNVLNCQRYWRDHPRTYINLTQEFEHKEKKALFLSRDQLHLAVEVDRPAKRLKLFINGELYASYLDPAPKPPAGSSMILASYGNGAVSVEDIRVYKLEQLTKHGQPIANNTALLRDGTSLTGDLVIKDGFATVNDRTVPLIQVTGAALSPKSPASADSTLRFHLKSGGRLGGHAKSTEQTLHLHHALLGDLDIPLPMIEGMLVNGTLPSRMSQPAGRAVFKNGDQLAGTLRSWNEDDGLQWQWPGGDSALSFPARSLAELYLEPGIERPTPSTILRLSSGDALPGKVTSMKANEVMFETAFSNEMRVPVPVIRKMDFEEPASVYYRGPDGSLADWKQSAPDVDWKYGEDGELVGRGTGGLGQAIPMPERGRLDIELSWVGQLDTSITLFARNLTRPVQPNTYRIHCENEKISLYRGLSQDEVAQDQGDDDPLRNRRLAEQLERFAAQFGGGASRRLGSPVPVTFNSFKHSRFLTLCWDQETASLALLFDGKVLRTWTDPSGLVQPANGLVIHQHGQATVLRIRSIQTRAWNGILPDPPLDDKATKDLKNTIVRLRNQDEFRVETLGLKAPRTPLTFDSELGPLALPMDRLEFIQFPIVKYPIEFRLGLVVDGYLSPAGLCRFFLTKIEGTQVHVTSPYFGENVLQLDAFRKLTFDLQDRAYWDRQTVPWPISVPVSMRPILQTREAERKLAPLTSENDGSKFNESVEFDE